MIMSSKTAKILKATYVLFYLAFIALCILTGSLLFNYFYSQFINPIAAFNLNQGLNLADLMSKDPANFHLLMWLLILIAATKALMFYFIIKIPYTLNISQPFTADISQKILHACYAAFGSSVLLAAASKLSERITGRGITLVKIENLVSGGGEFLMMACILFFVAYIFKRGIEIQTENDLTI